MTTDTPSCRFRHQGERCLSVDLGDHIDELTGLRCLALAERIKARRIEGVLDIVASFISVTVHYRPSAALSRDPAGFLQQLIQAEIDVLLEQGDAALGAIQARSVIIPVCYGGEHGPDLAEVATRMGMREQDVITAHSASPVRVFLLGFAPGHPYIGIHDERFAIPRRDTPRTAVPAGSVGIANRQSTIYPNRLPGGWQIIGATPLRLFDPEAASPTLLNPGDQIIFKPITDAQFRDLQTRPSEGPGA